jgi:phage-related minor tail protein
MSLLVGQLIAQLILDTTPYQAKASRMTGEHAKLVKQLSGDKVVLDGDAKPLEQANDKARKSTTDTAKAIDSAFAAAWRSVAADLQRIEKDAWESGDGMDKAFTSSLDHVKATLRDLRTEASKTGAGLDSQLGEALRQVQEEARQLGEAGRQGGQDLVEGFSEALGSVGGGGIAGELVSSFTSGKNAFLGAGLSLGALLVQGIQQRWAELKVGALIAAQTGAAASEIGRLGSLAGDLYATGFGESLEEAGEAIAASVNVLIPDDAADSAIARISSKVQTLGTVMGEEFGNISRAARTMLLNGMAPSVGQALDLIAEGTEQGLNIAGDFLDTLSEYSGQFAALGLDGQAALGLLSQALQGGARDTDFAADALKEFSLLAVDTSGTAARGFTTLGFNAEEMAAKVAAGGGSARQALRDVLNALQGLPPGIERSTAATDLFGTKAEDLAGALYDMDLDNAAEQFDDFAGSVEEMAQKMQEAIPFTDQLGRGFNKAAADVAAWFDSWDGNQMDEMTQQANEVALAFDRWKSTGDTTWLDEVKKKYPQVAEGIDRMIEANRDGVESQNALAGAANTTTGAYEKQIKALGELVEEDQKRAGGVLSLSEAEIAYRDSIDAANQSIKDNKKNLDTNTEAGRNNRSALNDLADDTWSYIESMEAQNATTDEVRRFMGTARDQFIKTATAMGMGGDEAKALADKLGLIPGNYKASVQVTGVELAKQRAQSLIDLIRGMPTTKLINLRVNTSGMPGGHFFAGQATGSIAEFYAAGGLRPMEGNAAGVIQSFSRTGVMRVIGDNPRFDEAYIPLDPSSSRSQAIMDEALKRMRPEFLRGNGSGSGGAGTAGAYVDQKRINNFQVSGPDPRAVAREVIELLDARDALRGP